LGRQYLCSPAWAYRAHTRSVRQADLILARSCRELVAALRRDTERIPYTRWILGTSSVLALWLELLLSVLVASVTAGADNGRVVVRWHAADAGTGVLLETAVVDPDTSTRPVTQGERLELSSGPHWLVVLAFDRAGNARSQNVVFVVP
jgi:hypothetical protein